MNQEETLLTLKKDVRTLLISSKTGLDPDQLRRDYVNMFGYGMPLKELGFRNIMDMVKQMPDIVSLHFQGDGSLLLKGVGDETTQGIEKLVAKQRSTKKSKISSMRYPNMFSSQRYYKPHVVFLPRRGPAPTSLPANLRAQLRILLSQGPVRLSDLEMSYLRCYGQPLRIQSYGFFSTGEMLNAAADMIVIQQSRFGSVLSLRESMVPRPVGTFSPLKRKPEVMEPRTPTEKSVLTEIQTNCLTDKSSVNMCNDKPLDPVISESTCDRTSDQIESLAHYEDLDLKQRILKLDEELRQQMVENGVAGTISQELKNKLRQVVGQSTDGLSVHELPSAYQRLFGEELPLVQSGFVSTTEFVGAMNDIFHLKPSEEDGKQDWTITDVEHDVEHTDLQESGDSDSALKSQMRINHLISGESRWETQQESSVDDDVNSSDENDEMEFNDIVHFNQEVPEQYNVIQVHSSSPAIPLDAILCQCLKPPTRRPARELSMVLVEWVESPGHFYVRLSETEESRALENMLIHMRQCYKCPKVSERYRLPESYIRQGQACCVSPCGMWFYRVIIHQIISPSEVEVYYVDYGNMTVVKSADLKFLKTIYSALPAQAIPASLAGIAPTTGSWSSAATSSFQTLSCDRALVGALDFYVGDVLQLYLCNTETDQDVYIHSVLISQGHGVVSISSEMCAQVIPVSLYLGTNMVDLPEIQTQTSSFQPQDALQSTVESVSKDYEDDMPGLMLIDDGDLTPLTLHPDRGSFNVLRNEQSVSCGEWDSTLLNSLPSVSSSPLPPLPPLPPPDLVHPHTVPGLCSSDKTQTSTPPSTSESLTSSSSFPDVQNVTKVTTAAIFKPPLIQSMWNQVQDGNQGGSFSSLCWRKCSNLPVFGGRYFY